jgi:hypothetical protein
MVYPALLQLMRTPRLPVVDGTDAPTDLNGLVRFAERRNLVFARVQSHFKRSLLGGNVSFPYLRTITQLPVINTIRFYDLNIPFHLLNARISTRLYGVSRLKTPMH